MEEAQPNMNSKPQVQLNFPLGVEDIEHVIPHRYPFLLVDRVDEIEIGQRIKARKNVSANEAYFQGHFPHFKVMPGVLIVECLAQAGAILASLSEERRENSLYFFASIEAARFKIPVRPGDILVLEVKIEQVKGSVGKFSGIAYSKDEIAAQAKFTCVKKNIR